MSQTKDKDSVTTKTTGVSVHHNYPIDDRCRSEDM